MKLSELLSATEILSVAGDTSISINSITCDSRTVSSGTLFFALKGVNTDGHKYIQQAIASGASAIVLESPEHAPDNTTWVHVKDGRQAMAYMASLYYGNPTGRLPLAGITGTNGKTTTSYLLEAILGVAGIPTAVLGTINYRLNNIVIESSHTTPESTELQGIFRQLADAGARAFVMEVSSHSLEQHRVDGASFDIGVFTNLTRDHLDYHGTMAAYTDAKLRLFSELLKPDNIKPHRFAVVNNDDNAAPLFIKSSACPVITYGMKEGSDVTATDVSSSVEGIRGVLVTPAGKMDFCSKLAGRYNLSNILAAVAAATAFRVPLDIIVNGLSVFETVPGRLEKVQNSCGVTCLVDYAHTGDALENVLCTLSELATRRIITVFGCGGDRDVGKRPVMGEISGRYSDLSIITSDNPRTENPYVILDNIREGIRATGINEYTEKTLDCDFKEKGYLVIENRRDAIRLAVSLARHGDILLIAGKGHEDYQITAAGKFHFDDREEAAKAFRERT